MGNESKLPISCFQKAFSFSLNQSPVNEELEEAMLEIECLLANMIDKVYFN